MILTRQATPEDAEAALGFYHDLIDKLKESPYRPTWTRGVYPLLSDLEAAIRREELFLAVDSDAVVGAVIVTDRQDEAYGRMAWGVDTARVAVLHLIAAGPDRRGEGIGRLLLQTAEEVARRRGAEVIRLDTLPHNAPARHLYESYGFRYLGELKIYYPSAGTIPFAMYEYPLVR